MLECWTQHAIPQLKSQQENRSDLVPCPRHITLPPVLPDIKSLTRDDLAARFKEWSLPAYRLDQTLRWLYTRRVTAWDGMTNLPKPLREQLRLHFTLNTLELVRKQGADDTTQKFLWKLSDGAMVESVLIPASPALYGEASDRHTLCVSTQVGCAYGCKFCASGLEGFKRNLRVDEIVEQSLAIALCNLILQHTRA